MNHKNLATQDYTATLIQTISTILKLHKLDDEVAVFYLEHEFAIEACNPSRMVSLGESSGKFRSKSASLIDALENVLEQVRLIGV